MVCLMRLVNPTVLIFDWHICDEQHCVKYSNDYRTIILVYNLMKVPIP